MACVDLVISNDGHHAAMFQPVARFLERHSGIRLRVVSLCEFRGIDTPEEMFPRSVELHRIMRVRYRKSSTGLQSSGSRKSVIREVVRQLSWLLLLRNPINKWLRSKPSLVVLPNDAAFPYGRIARLLKRRGIPFVLVQEGIRFGLPNAEGDEYGKNGAAAIAAWGENSARFFNDHGTDGNRVHLTGSPRYDDIVRCDWKAEAARMQKVLGVGSRTLLLLTNPIDDQGFCTAEEKMELVTRFLRNAGPLFSDPSFSIIVKLHGRESEEEYLRVCRSFAYADRIHVLKSVDLYPLLTLAKASIVFASTVGLESLLFDCALGVLEIPGFGFVHDYVSSNAAVGLAWENDMEHKIRELMEPDDERTTRAKAYVGENLAYLGCATEKVSDLILQQLPVEAYQP